MAALNFPNSPSVNDIHTENGVSFKWNGTIWKKVGASYLDTTNLNVTGIGTFGGDLYIADKIIHTGDTNTVLRFPANDTVSVETAGQQNVQVNGTRVLLKSPSGTNTTVRLQHQGNSGYGDIILDRTVNAFIIDNDPSNASSNQSYFSVKNKGTENLRIDSSGRVLIGGTTQAGDGQLIVYSSDRLHPAIKCAGQTNNYGNGHTLIGDNYQTDESQVNLGVSYSSASLVLSRGCKVSGSADNTYLSSQDSYATRPCALRLNEEGAISFWTTETSATTTTDSAVSLTEVFSIDRVGNIRQKISNRYMYFGANQELAVGVNGSDPYVNAVSGDLQIRDAGNAIANVRSDGLQMYQDIYFATAGKGIVLGATSNVDANTLDDYEEGNLSWKLKKSGASSGTNNGGLVSYTKIGRMVCISGKIRTDGAGSNANDNFVIDGTLPFAPATNGTAVIGHFRSQDDTTGTLTASIAWMGGSSTLYVYTCVTKSDYTANENNVGVSNQTNLVMTFSFTYIAS